MKKIPKAVLFFIDSRNWSHVAYSIIIINKKMCPYIAFSSNFHIVDSSLTGVGPDRGRLQNIWADLGL
jgi:hypothetical protein